MITISELTKTRFYELQKELIKDNNPQQAKNYVDAYAEKFNLNIEEEYEKIDKQSKKS